MPSPISHIDDLIRHRSLISHLAGRELKARYRGSVLGFLWSFLNPLLLLLVYALVFSVYMRLDMENYAGFMFTGLLPWIWVSSALLDSTSAIVHGGSLVTKVIFPLQVLPAVKQTAALANYLLGLPILLIFLLASGVGLSWTMLLFPLVVLAGLPLVYGLGLFLAALNVAFRDVQHVLTNLLTLWFFLTPILYPAATVPQPFWPLLKLNPMARLMMAFQDVFFHHRPPDWLDRGLVFVFGLLVAVAGMGYFDRRKESFAELV